MIIEKEVHVLANDYPVDTALCAFKHKDGRSFIGYMDWSIYDLESPIVCLTEKRQWFKISDIYSYQYILNDNGGFLFITLPKE